MISRCAPRRALSEQYQAIVDDFRDPDDAEHRSMSAPVVVTVLGLGEAGGRLAADLVAAGVEVRGYDPLTTSRPGGRRQGRRPRRGSRPGARSCSR